MSEFGIRPPESVRESVRASENVVEEAWREDYLSRHLFHGERGVRSYRISDLNRFNELDHHIQDFAPPEWLEQDFLADKRGLNMGERFALALDEKYLGKIHVVELGSTNQPDDSGAIDGLRSQYNDLLDWLKNHDIVKDELSRKESGRTISMRPPKLSDHASQVMVVIRNRLLIDTVIEHEGREVKVMIAKRMVFGMTTQAAKALLTRDPKLEQESTKEIIETQLHHGSGGVHPIRTAYYLATDIIC